jgi:hypothetical protein
MFWRKFGQLYSLHIKFIIIQL